MSGTARSGEVAFPPATIDNAILIGGTSAVVIRSIFAFAALVIWFEQGTPYFVVPYKNCEQSGLDVGTLECNSFGTDTNLEKHMTLPESGFDSKLVTVLSDSSVYSALSFNPPQDANTDSEYGFDRHEHIYLIGQGILRVALAISAYLLVRVLGLAATQAKFDGLHALLKFGVVNLIGHIISWMGEFIVNLMTISLTSMSCRADVPGAGVYSALSFQLDSWVGLIFLSLPHGTLLAYTLLAVILGGGIGLFIFAYCDEEISAMLFVAGISGYIFTYIVAGYFIREVMTSSAHGFTVAGIFTGVGGHCATDGDAIFGTTRSLLQVTMVFGIIGEIIGWVGIALGVYRTIDALCKECKKEYAPVSGAE